MDRRHITTAVTMLLLVGILVLGLVVGYQSLFKPIDSDNTTQSCKTQDKGQRIRTKEVQVSVFNAGTRSGLAGETLDSLSQRGFRSGDIGNAPETAKVVDVQVWTTQKSDRAAKLVALQFGPRMKVMVKDENLGPGVDVLVGNGYDGLGRPQKSLKVKRKPVEVCVTKDDKAA